MARKVPGSKAVIDVPKVEVKGASNWADVVNSAAYQNARPEGKQYIQRSFYNTYIKGKAREQGIDETAAQESFYKYANSSLPTIVKVTNNLKAIGRRREDPALVAFGKGFVSNVEGVIPAVSGMKAILTKPVGGLATIGMEPQDINDWAFVNRKELLQNWKEEKATEIDYPKYREQTGEKAKDFKGWFNDHWREYTTHSEKKLKEMHKISTKELKGKALERTKQRFLADAAAYEPLIDVTPELASRWAFKIGGGFGSVAKFSAYHVMGVGMPMMVAEATGTAYNQVSAEHPDWSETKKTTYAMASGAIEGTLEAWGSTQLLRPLTNAGSISLRSAIKKGIFYNLIKQSATNFVTESTQEASQEIGQNVLSNLYGVDRNLFAGIVDAWAIGGIVGAAFGVGTGSMTYNKTMNNYNATLKYQGFSDAEIGEISKRMNEITNDALSNEKATAEAVRLFKNSSLVRAASPETQELAKTLVKDGASEEEIRTVMQNTTDTQREVLVSERVLKETPEQRIAYENDFNNFVSTLEQVGIIEDEADAQGALVDAMVMKEAIRRETSREQILKDLSPIVTAEYTPEFLGKEMDFWTNIAQQETEEKRQIAREAITEEQIAEFIGKYTYDIRAEEETDALKLFRKWVGTKAIKVPATPEGKMVGEYAGLQRKKGLNFSAKKGVPIDDVLSEFNANNPGFEMTEDEFRTALIKQARPTQLVEAPTREEAITALMGQRLYQESIERGERVYKEPPPALFQKRRGAFQRTDGRSIITLFEDADRSTLLHETGHMFLTYYMEFNPEGLNEVKKWAGVRKPLDQLTPAEYTKFQERFARGFEVYLREGKAPSQGLAKVFEDFKKWLTDVYNSVTDLNITINDDVRSFFDEMLAVPEDRKIAITPEVEAVDLEGVQLYQDLQEKINQVKEETKGMRKTIRTEARLEIAALQKQLTDRINELKIEKEDKGKLLTAVRRANTAVALAKEITNVENKAIQFYEMRQKDFFKEKIKRELKYTKPVKKGVRAVGKYDYLANKYFEDLREYNKYTKEQAANKFKELGYEDNLDMSPEEVMRAEFLDFKARGKKFGSAELFKNVYNHLKEAKALARDSKDFDDFMRRLNRKERVTGAIESIDATKFKGNAKSIFTKILNFYRAGFSNINSMLNSIAGKKFAEKYDPELKESQKATAIYYKTKEAVDEGSRIFKLDSSKQFTNRMDTMTNQKFKLVDPETGDIDITKLDLLNMYNALKNEKRKNDYYTWFGEEQVKELMGNITEQEASFADYLQELVQEYRPMINEKHIERFGRDMGFVENYWPSASEHTEDFYDDIRQQGEMPGFMKKRVKGRVIPKPQNMWVVFNKFVNQAEHIDKMSDSYRDLKKMFSDRVVKSKVIKKYGESVYNTLQMQIDNLSLNAEIRRTDEVSNAFGKALGNWVSAKVALNPAVFAKQLISVGNYMEDMPVATWSAHFAAGVANPKATIDFMMKNAPFLEARYKRGYSEAIQRALHEAKNIALKEKWTRGLTSLVRMGDIGAIMFGGYPVIKHLTAQGMTMKEAVAEFERRTLKSQQSGLSSGLSALQNAKNPFARFFLAFKNTANQYLRKQGDAMIAYYNGDITATQLAKTLTIYGAIQPALYGYAGYLMRGLLYGADDDEFFDDILEAIAQSPLNAIPVANDLWTYAVRTASARIVGDRPPFKVFSTPLLDDLEKSFKKSMKILKGDDFTIFDVLESMSAYTEAITPLPVGTFTRITKARLGEKTGKKRRKKLKI